jgi:putative ABC transport system substrate-binding protein
MRQIAGCLRRRRCADDRCCACDRCPGSAGSDGQNLPPGRQHYRLHKRGDDIGREVAGAAQGEVAPHVTRVAFVFNPGNGGATQFWDPAAAAAPRLSVEMVMVQVRGLAEIEAAIALLGHEPSGGLIFPPDGFTLGHRKPIVELAARYRLPAIYGIQNFARDGGLVYYGVNIDDQYRQAAAYVDRILRGENPGDLPIQQPNKYELIINLKTAKALGLTILPTLLSRADEVIE